VEDSLKALQTVAARARENWPGDVVAVTGSAGKTTTKDVIAELLAVGIPVTKTEGNLNNHIGLPLSLLRLDETARVAVLEIGMNHAGEIISELTLAIAAGIGLGRIAGVIHPYPTQAEAIKKIADAYNRTRLTSSRKRLLTGLLAWRR